MSLLAVVPIDDVQWGDLWIILRPVGSGALAPVLTVLAVPKSCVWHKGISCGWFRWWWVDKFLVFIV